MNKPRISIFSLLVELLIDFALISMGVALYIHFLVYSFGPIGLSPVVVNLFGSKELAVWAISGIPIAVGLFSLFSSIRRLFKRKSSAKKIPTKS